MVLRTIFSDYARVALATLLYGKLLTCHGINNPLLNIGFIMAVEDWSLAFETAS